MGNGDSSPMAYNFGHGSPNPALTGSALFVLPWWGAGPALPSVAAGGGRDSFPALMATGQFSHLPQVLMGRQVGGQLFPAHYLDWLTHTSTNRVEFIVLLR